LREEGSSEKKAEVRVLAGRVLCTLGIILAVIGAYFVSVALGAVGIFLGVVGYSLGARNLGPVAVIIGLVSIFVGLLIGQAALPGSNDAALDGVKEALQDPFSDPKRGE
jgi:heme O synthase-like polyprenyltransferase